MDKQVHSQYGRVASVMMVAIILLPPIGTAAEIFNDHTQRSGINFSMTCGGKPSTTILEVDGGGVAFIDYDNDGDWDLFFANGATMEAPETGPGSRLYQNDGQGRFTDVTSQVGIDLKRWAMGVAVGDVDADGCTDIYVTCYGKNVLLKNECKDPKNIRFRDVAMTAGVDNKRWGTSAAFGDIDGDHDLDLYVVNYLDFDTKNPPDTRGMVFMGVPVMAGPAGLTAQHDVLYQNDGSGTFNDITKASGVRPDEAGYGLVTAIFDLDDDGRQDIFVGNDSNANFFFRNKGNATFEEYGLFSGLCCNYDGATQATMGIAVGDVDRNGLPDIFTTNFSSDTNTLHLNDGDGFFEDRTSQYGLAMISRPYLSWGCGFYDFDTDGDEDLFIASGHVYPQADKHAIDSDYLQPPLYFERQRQRFARNTTAGKALKQVFAGRSTAFGDIDQDGDVDIVMTTLNGPVKLLRNDGTDGRCMVVRLVDSGGNCHGLGASVQIDSLGVKQKRWIHGGSYQSANASDAYFSWRSKADPAEMQATVRWADGEKQTFKGLLPSHLNVLVRSSGKSITEKLKPRNRYLEDVN
ncbi:MAG: CRTAC1 family protein [Phycisphaerae bacterium]